MHTNPLSRDTVRAWMDRCMEMALDPTLNVDGMGCDVPPGGLGGPNRVLYEMREHLRIAHDVVVSAPLHTTYNEDAMAVYNALRELYPEG